jgi:ketosteroid isomerase-like protein
MAEELSRVREQYHDSVAAFVQGDAEAQKPLWSRRDDVTLANPFGPPVRGPERVFEAADRAAAVLRGGHGHVSDTISFVETADLAYEVAIERSRAVMGDLAEEVDIVLRVTTVFRREDDGWRIVHRHADPVTGPRSVDSVVQAMTGPGA